MPAKRRSYVTWSLLQGAQDDLHQSLLSAAHHATNDQALLLPNDSYADADSAQCHKLRYNIHNMLAAVWQLLCSMGGILRRWGQCWPSAAEADNNC